MGTRTVNGLQIDTANICPPIPVRTHDWMAAPAGYDLGDPVGFGATEQAAIDDLLEQLSEE